MMSICETCKNKSQEKYMNLVCLGCCYEYGCASEEEGLEMDYPKSSKYERKDEDET